MSSILEQLPDAQLLRQLSLPQLQELAEEIRREMIAVVSRRGGHLSPNLGVVELSIALHRTFDTPHDKLIWDVGHQCYPHKLLTGRYSVFNSLRTRHGIAGYPRRAESEYDLSDGGHSSTSISLGLGWSVGRDLQAQDYRVVVVIGDGAITAGMALEAINNAGYLRKNLIVVLNDNEKSISNNVGAFSLYLGKIRATLLHRQTSRWLDQLDRRWSKARLLKLVKRGSQVLRQLILPSKTGLIFEELGFTFLGPVDGHNLTGLEQIFQQAKKIEGPVLIQVVTQKGRGLAYAEADATKYHSLTQFDPLSGKTIKVVGTAQTPSYTEIFAQTMIELAQADERVVAITAAMLEGTGLSAFQKVFPQRCFDVGIAEQHAVTFACGLADSGLKPVCAIYSTFMQRAYDQLIHDACITCTPVVFALDRAGIVGEDGMTQQGAFDLAFMRTVPNLIMMSPKDENELRHMLKTALDYRDGPVVLRYPRGAGEGVALDHELKALPIGRAELLQTGQDVLIIGLGWLVGSGLEAARQLAHYGIDCGVINARFIKPLDSELITEQVRRARLVVTLEEGSLAGGFGSAVLELLADQGLKRPVLRFGLADEFVAQGKLQEMRESYGLCSSALVSKIRSALQKETGGYVQTVAS